MVRWYLKWENQNWVNHQS